MAAAPTIGLRHVTVVPTNFEPSPVDGEGRPEPSADERAETGADGS